MSDTMGTFRISVELAAVGREDDRRAVHSVLIDTGSELSWFPAEVLESLAIKRAKLSRFRQASGAVVERWTGAATIYAAGTLTFDEVVFAESTDMTILGARTLEGLNLTIDPANKRLIDAGPVLAAVAA